MRLSDWSSEGVEETAVLSDMGTLEGNIGTALGAKLGRVTEVERADEGCSIATGWDERLAVERADGGCSVATGWDERPESGCSDELNWEALIAEIGRTDGDCSIELNDDRVADIERSDEDCCSNEPTDGEDLILGAERVDAWFSVDARTVY